jgi:hypothetical protein
VLVVVGVQCGDVRGREQAERDEWCSAAYRTIPSVHAHFFQPDVDAHYAFLDVDVAATEPSDALTRTRELRPPRGWG